MMAATVTLEIDGRTIAADSGHSVLDAARAAGVYIPHLCSHPELEPVGGCGLCVVEIEGTSSDATATVESSHVQSCLTRVADGMLVHTQTDRVKELRRVAIELMLSRHPSECLGCDKYLNCELQSLKQYLGVSEELRVRKHPQPVPVDTGNPLFVRDMGRCVLCGRCVRACNELRGIGAISLVGRGKGTRAYSAFDRDLADAGCRFCGACVEVCPTGALRDKDEFVRGKNRRAALVPCKATCPAEIDVPRYVRLAAQGDFPGATAVVRDKAPFPRSLGYVCDHPCEGVCRRGPVSDAISIRELKRLAAENDDGSWRDRRRQKVATGKRVAIVGSGPAGLTAAYYLAGLGHGVTVFEALPVAGGMLRVGIPEYRLPRDVLEAEIAQIAALGVEIKLDTPVESLDALLPPGGGPAWGAPAAPPATAAHGAVDAAGDFDAVLVAVGAHAGGRLRVPGGDLAGTTTAVDFLRRVNLGEDVVVGERVVVLGGGNVAFDCARVARRLGAREVLVSCLEPRDTMLAGADEIAEGEEEGVVVQASRTFSRFTEDQGRVTGVECLLVESFAFDDDGHLEIEQKWGSDHTLPADTIILAVGQRPEIPEGWELDLTSKGTIELDSYSGGTSREGVFAAGDAVSGTASVIKAIASGRAAATAIDKYLDGTGDLDEGVAPPQVAPDPWLGPGEGFAARRRAVRSCAPAEERLTRFCRIVEELDPDAGMAEAARCLQCDLRLKIERVKYWGEY